MSSRESCTVVHNTLRNNHSLEPHYFIPLHQQSNLQQTKIYKYTAESHWKVIREASLLTWGSSDTRQLKNRLVMKASPRRANLSHAEPVLHSSPPCFSFFSAWWQLNFFMSTLLIQLNNPNGQIRDVVVLSLLLSYSFEQQWEPRSPSAPATYSTAGFENSKAVVNTIRAGIKYINKCQVSILQKAMPPSC